MLPPLCICALVPKVPTRTRVLCILHKVEQWKTTNTGHLAAKCLPNCELRVRGVREQELDLRGFDDPAFRTVVLFPSDDAELLDAAWVARDPRPVQLIVPDGTWKQARRIVNRVPALRAATKVVIPRGDASRYGLRRAPREDGVCTFEAIVAALRVLEGEQVRAPLEHIFQVFVDRTRWSRGDIPADQVTGGISREAIDFRGSMSSGFIRLDVKKPPRASLSRRSPGAQPGPKQSTIAAAKEQT